MSEDFMQELAGATTFSSGNRFRAGRGVLIVKDIKIFKSKKLGGDPFTEAAEFIVKRSFPTEPGTEPNLPGTSVSTIFKLTRGEYFEMQRSNALKLHLAIFGPAAEGLSKPELAERLKWLLRPGGADQPKDLQGRTMPGTLCPARGYQVAYETIKSKKGGDFPEFTYIETTEADLAENLKILAGAAESSDGE